MPAGGPLRIRCHCRPSLTPAVSSPVRRGRWPHSPHGAAAPSSPNRQRDQGCSFGLRLSRKPSKIDLPTSGGRNQRNISPIEAAVPVNRDSCDSWHGGVPRPIDAPPSGVVCATASATSSSPLRPLRSLRSDRPRDAVEGKLGAFAMERSAHILKGGRPGERSPSGASPGLAGGLGGAAVVRPSSRPPSALGCSGYAAGCPM